MTKYIQIQYGIELPFKEGIQYIKKIIKDKVSNKEYNYYVDNIGDDKYNAPYYLDLCDEILNDPNEIT